MDYLTEALKNFVTRPFSEDMDVGEWAAFTGLIVLLAILWTRVLKHVLDEA